MPPADNDRGLDIEELDRIGPWSEVKLEIISKYAKAFTTIVNSKGFKSVYVDAFAGPGAHLTKAGALVPGSPLNALRVEPKFDRYYFIDLDRRRVRTLEEYTGQRSDVSILEGDCNRRLPQDVFPHIRYEHYRRGLCLLDPYGLHLSWDVIKMAGEMKTIDLFLNFPLADMNRNVLWHEPDRVSPCQALRMTRFWGDESWSEATYRKELNLFGDESTEKVGNPEVARAFRTRLQERAGFKYVADPIPMRNSTRAIIYYLFFASQQPVAVDIVKDIAAKYNPGV